LLTLIVEGLIDGDLSLLAVKSLRLFEMIISLGS